MKYTYRTSGTCSQVIEIDIEDDVIKNVSFYGGCDGNLNGISQLVKGQTIDNVIARLRGIKCGMKSTSCPDQLATALLAIKKEK